MLKLSKYIRFDDVNANTNYERLGLMVHKAIELIPDVNIMLCLSPFAFDIELPRFHNQNTPLTELQKERVFPAIYTAMSDHKIFYDGDHFINPEALEEVLGDVEYIRASHGLVHCDHRLMSRDCQEMSILLSCRFLKSHVFVPPFNKWNYDTEIICEEHGILLVKFEDGWLHSACNPFERDRFADGKVNYYLHTFDMSNEHFEGWIRRGM